MNAARPTQISPAYVVRYIAPHMYAVKSRDDLEAISLHDTMASAVEHAAALNKQVTA